MKINKTELVYVPKDLCSNALVSRMSINDKDTITDTTIFVMIDCLSIVRLPYLNLNVMFYEVDCMKFSNKRTVCRAIHILRKNPIERVNIANYIIIDVSHHQLQNQVKRQQKGEEALQYDLTSIVWHNVIAITNRFDNLIRGGVYVPACRLYICNCNDTRDRQICVVVHSSCNMTDESVYIIQTFILAGFVIVIKGYVLSYHEVYSNYINNEVKK